MKRTLVAITLAVALGALVGQAFGQYPGYGPMGYDPQMAYAQQMAYSQQMAYAQQMAYMQQAGGMPAPAVNPGMTAAPGGACAGGACAGGTCSDAACEAWIDPACYDCGPEWEFFGEFLYLRARDVEVPYAVIANGPATAGAVPLQRSRIGLIDSDYQPGFRVGFSRSMDDRANIRAQYTFYESHTSDSISEPGAQDRILFPLAVHPSTSAVYTTDLDAWAEHDIDFQIVDMDYRCMLFCGPRHEVTLVGGLTYVHLEQEFNTVFGVLGEGRVDTNIKFDGGGLRIGLEGERRGRNCGFLVYGKAMASFAAGEFQADYLQRQGTSGLLVNTSWDAGRVISLLDLELGFGWSTPGEGFRITAGYMMSGWFNVVQTDEFIRAVQGNDFLGLGDSMTFDGFTARAEMRF